MAGIVINYPLQTFLETWGNAAEEGIWGLILSLLQIYVTHRSAVRRMQRTLWVADVDMNIYAIQNTQINNYGTSESMSYAWWNLMHSCTKAGMTVSTWRSEAVQWPVSCSPEGWCMSSCYDHCCNACDCTNVDGHSQSGNWRGIQGYGWANTEGHGNYCHKLSTLDIPGNLG